MGYKLICLDMDGTLLDDSKDVSHRNKEAIKNANAKGVKVAISTGRVFTSAKYYAALLGVNAPIIASNGAYIREKDGNDIIYKSLLSAKECQKIIEAVKDYDLTLYFNTFDTIISLKPYPKGYTYLQMNNEVPEDMKIKLHVSHNLEKEIQENHYEIVKAICISNNIEDLNEARKKIMEFSEFEVASSNSDNFEMTKKGTSKGKAVEVLADFYNIKRDEVICMGDGENDLSMIEYAGLGIAMGNASSIVKKRANYVTDTNCNDGVAKAIEKFVL